MKEIEKIIDRYQNTNWDIEKVALGTVVRVEESSYRRIGARMFVSNNGQWIGGISGGCLEGDALKRAQIAISKNENSVVIYDTMEDDSHQIGIGLGCNGRIDVLFTPIDKEDTKNAVERLIAIKGSREASIFAQVIGSSSNKQVLGKIYSQYEFKEAWEALKLHRTILEDLFYQAKTQKKSRVVYLKNEDGDEYELLIECIWPKTKLICIGDNYDVNSMVSIAYEIGWEIHIAGKVRKFSQHVFDHATTVNPLDRITDIELDDQTAVILMSHDFKTDLKLIRHFLMSEVPYIGLLGPKKRMRKIENELKKQEPDIDLSSCPNLFAPTGLDIGAESPEEIALSIVAEIIASMRRRPGLSLKERVGPIHDRV